MQFTIEVTRTFACPVCGSYFSSVLQADERGLFMQCYSCKRNFDVQIELEQRPEQTADGLPF